MHARIAFFTLLLVFGFFVPAAKPALTVRYVAASGGSNSNCTTIQTSSTPASTIAFAVGCMSSGDITYLRGGTYTQDINTNTVAIPTGTPSAWTTISGYPGEVAILRSGGSEMINIPGPATRAYISIENMVIDGQMTSNETVSIGADSAHHIRLVNVEMKNCGHRCASLHHPGHDNTITGGSMHDVGNFTLYPTPANYHYGVYAEGLNSLVEFVDFYNIPSYAIHGSNSYVTGSGNIFRYNRFRHNGYTTGDELTFGSATIYHNDGTQFYGNVIYDCNTKGLEVSGGSTNALIRNNTIIGCAGTGLALSGSGHILENNILLGNGGGGNLTGTPAVNNTNVTSGSITTYVVSATDARLISTSPAINAGTARAGFTCNGTCDIGAFEAVPPSSAQIDQTTMEITFNSNIAKDNPLLPSTGITGFSVSCTGTSCGTPVVSTAVRKAGSDNIVQLGLTGIGGTGKCLSAQTWKWAYTPGNLTNNARIGGLINQAIFAASNQSVTATCSGGGTSPPVTGLKINYLLDENTGTTAVDGTAPTENGTNVSGTWVPGRTGSALSFADGLNQYLDVPWGASIDPSVNSVSVCFDALPHATTFAQKIVFATSTSGSGQRFYVGHMGGTWALGIQGSAFDTGSEFAVRAEITRLCLVANATTDTATLYVNAVKGTSAQTVKAYTSFSLASNFRFGQESAFAINYGGVTIDNVNIWENYALSDAEVAADLAALQPVTPPPSGTLTIAGGRFKYPRMNVSNTADNLTALNAEATVRAGGYLAMDFQIDATVADPAPSSYVLYDTITSGGNSVSFAMPDVANNANVQFYGSTGEASLAIESLVTPYRLTSGGPAGAGTIVPGGTQVTASAVPIVDLCQNCSVVLRYIVQFLAGAAPNDRHCFTLKNQADASALNGGQTPVGGLCATVKNAAGTVF